MNTLASTIVGLAAGLAVTVASHGHHSPPRTPERAPAATSDLPPCATPDSLGCHYDGGPNGPSWDNRRTGSGLFTRTYTSGYAGFSWPPPPERCAVACTPTAR